MARAQGQQTHCMGNLRELTRAATMYAHDDEADIFGPVHPLAWKFGAEGYAEYGGGPGDVPYQNWFDEFDPRSRQLNWLMYGGRNFASKMTTPGDRRVFLEFQCPGDDLGWQEWPKFLAPPNETERPYFFSNGTSYRFNNWHYQESSYDSIWTLGVYGRQMTGIPEPSNTVSFMEARAQQTEGTNEQWGTQRWPSCAKGYLTGYHKKLARFNLAFVDGHVGFEYMGLGSFYPQSGRYFGLEMRGTWGQMDCFPAREFVEPFEDPRQ